MSRLILVIVSLLLSFNVEAKEIRRVLVTIKPIHSLVSCLMEGIDTPELLIQDNQSPHTHQLRPSEAHKLENADVIIWVGEIYETGLAKRIAYLQESAEVITVSELKDVQLYPNRQFGGEHHHHDEGCHHHDHDHDHHHGPTQKDGHIWLSPSNAKAIVVGIAQKLSALDPKNAVQYQANLEKTVTKLNDLMVELAKEAAPLKDKRYMLVHDFSQYFDRYFGSKAVGVIRFNPSLEPTPHHIKTLMHALSSHKATAIFSEPQFANKLPQQLAEKTGSRYGVIDCLGADLDPGVTCYFELMRRLVFNMKQVLL